MSAPIDHSSLQFANGEPIILAATLWRGAMIQRFAQIEGFVDRSLGFCAGASLVSATDAQDTLPRRRFNILLKALDVAKPAGWVNAKQSLQQAYDLWDDRNALCHGIVEPKARSIVLRWTARDNSGVVARHVKITPTEMLEKLHELDRVKTILGSRLGQIDKVWRDLASSGQSLNSDI